MGRMSTPRSIGRKLLVALGVLVGLVVLLVALLLVAVSSGAVTKRAVDLVLPSASKALGREVGLRDAKLKLFPNPRVTLAGLSVAGRPGEPALVDAEALEVEVALWPLLRSLGKDVQVTAFSLVRPSVNLVKAKDGTWNFEGLGQPPGGAAPSPSPAPPAEQGQREAARVAVGLVKIEQAAIRVVDRSQGREDVGLALTQLDLEAHGVGPGLPLDARLAAALADTRQNLNAQLSVAKLPAGVPQRPEDWPEVQGQIRLTALALDRLHGLLPGDVGAIVRGGTATLDARLATVPQGGYRVDGSGELRDVRLRGQSSSGHFKATAAWSPAKPDHARVDVTDLALRGPGIDLGGNLSLETPPVRAWFVLTGSLLDVDAIMGVLPESPQPAAQPKPAPQAAAPAGGDLVPAATRKQIQAASARGTVAVQTLKAGRVEATDVKARAVLSNGVLTLEDLSASVFGGRVSAAGTHVALAEKVPTWRLAADLTGVELEKALAAFGQAKTPLLGKVDGRLEVAGQGTEWEKMRDGLDGLAALAIKDGTLTTTSLGDSVLGGVAKGLEAVGRGGAAKKVASGEGGKTRFRDLSGKFTVKDGALTPQSPLKVETGAGELTLGGKIGLDQRLGLEGTATVPKKVLAEAISGVPLPEKLDVPLAIGGTLTSPSVSVRGDQAVAGLLKGSAKAAAQDLGGKAQSEGKKALEGVLKKFGR
jgi:AsmA protein